MSDVTNPQPPHPIREPVAYTKWLYVRGRMDSRSVNMHVARVLRCTVAEAEAKTGIRSFA